MLKPRLTPIVQIFSLHSKVRKTKYATAEEHNNSIIVIIQLSVCSNIIIQFNIVVAVAMTQT